MSSSSSFGSGTAFGTTPLGTSPFYNVSSLIDGVLYTTGHSNPSTETTKRAAILQFLNNRYQFVCLGRHWRWMQAAYDFNITAPYEVGSCDLDQDSSVVTGNGTIFDATMATGNIFFFKKDSDVYHIASVDSPTQVTLETTYAGDGDVTDGAYTICKTQYRLPKETDQLLSIVMDNRPAKLVPVGLQELRRIQSQQPCLSGPPLYYSLTKRDTDDDGVYFEVYPIPDQRYNLHIDYTVRILKLDDSTDCYPIIPDRYRTVLYYGALAEFFIYLRDPSNAGLAEQQYQKFYNQMANDTQLTDSRLIFQPARKYRRGLRRYKIFMDQDTFGRED